MYPSCRFVDRARESDSRARRGKYTERENRKIYSELSIVDKWREMCPKYWVCVCVSVCECYSCSVVNIGGKSEGGKMSIRHPFHSTSRNAERSLKCLYRSV